MIDQLSSATSKPAPAVSAPAPAATRKPSASPDVVPVAPISPRLRYDSTSGVVVTEFLKENGNVDSQIPSAAVLAYLRVGLQADGTGAPQENAEPLKA